MKEQDRRQLREGDVSELESPTADGVDVIYVYRGYLGDERRQRIRECSGVDALIAGVSTSEEIDRWNKCTVEVDQWSKARENTMQRFLDLVETLCRHTDLLPQEAAGFLLCDLDVSLPRFRVGVRYHSSGVGPGVHLTLDIYDLHIAQPQVQKVYRNLRASLLAGERGSPLRWRSRLRHQDDKTTLIAFVEKKRRDRMKFADIYRQWDTEYGDKWHYETSHSLYNAYKAAVRRWSE